MSEITKVALDAMGGDNAPKEIIKGAVDAVSENSNIEVYLVGSKDALESAMSDSNWRRVSDGEKVELLSLDIAEGVDKIAKGYQVDNSPLLVQAIVNGDDVKVIEFSARLGGGAKYKTIQNVTGFNVLQANLESMLGEKPKVVIHDDGRCYSRCHIYTNGGVFTAIEGLGSLQQRGIIDDYVLTKPVGVTTGLPISASSKVELKKKVEKAIGQIKVVDETGEDMLYREMYKSALV